MSKVELLDTPYQYFISTIDLNRLGKHESEMFYTPIYSNFLKHCSDIFNVSNRKINIDQIKSNVLKEHNAVMSFFGVKFENIEDYTRFLLTFG